MRKVVVMLLHTSATGYSRLNAMQKWGGNERKRAAAFTTTLDGIACEMV